MKTTIESQLIQKYNVPVPRYTSYPTVPYWKNDTFSLKKWKASLIDSFNESNSKEGVSLYIHLPFCESLCTFCGCHKRITKRHEVEMPYINAVLTEWDLYCKLFEGKPNIKELHLGGGTPTFFSPDHLKQLINGILNKSNLAVDYEFSFEGHPNNTSTEHLETLYDLGFRRVSFGVQDYNETVQRAIHRIQSFEMVKWVTEEARRIGYTSIGHDIIFGLPFQTAEHIITTVQNTQLLQPDRLAFYSYAHVPWMKGNGQRGFRGEDLPFGEEKQQQCELGKQLLTNAGYHEIGMDHFSLSTDSLYQSMKKGNLNRNFMGYTTSKTKLLIGLGVSAISDSWYGFSQNVKGVEEYQYLVNEQIIPALKGHILTNEDLIMRTHILNLMCRFETEWSQNERYSDYMKTIIERLTEMENDQLVRIDENSIKVTEQGKPFIRNICMAFDMHLHRDKRKTQLFSMTI